MNKAKTIVTKTATVEVFTDFGELLQRSVVQQLIKKP